MVRALERARWRVTWFQSGPGLDEAIGRRKPDVVVWVLEGDKSATSLLLESAVELKSIETPILVVCEVEAVAALGRARWVDDFLVRPIRQGELESRLERILGQSPSALDVMSVGPLSVDTKGFIATLDGAPMSLTYQEFRLLRFLMQHPNEVFTRDQLLARVWSYDYFGGPRTVDIHVRRLRAKLGPSLGECIETVRCVGYRWVPEHATAT
jgi:DNA-binding response OmpR family regulator